MKNMEEPRKVAHWHDHFNVSERICFSCIFLHVWYFVIKSAKFTSCLLCFKSRCHGVGEGHHTALGVSQPGVKVNQTHLPGYVYEANSQLQWPAIVQELQENVEDVRMRLFHLFRQRISLAMPQPQLFNHVPHQRVPRSMASVEQPERLPTLKRKIFKRNIWKWCAWSIGALLLEASFCAQWFQDRSKLWCIVLAINASAQLRKTAKPAPCFCGQYWNLITSTTMFWCLGHIWSQH